MKLTPLGPQSLMTLHKFGDFLTPYDCTYAFIHSVTKSWRKALKKITKFFEKMSENQTLILDFRQCLKYELLGNQTVFECLKSILVLDFRHWLYYKLLHTSTPNQRAMLSNLRTTGMR